MATSGSFTTGNTSGIGAQYPKNATFSWWQNGQSVSGNYTDIGWNFKLGGGSSNNSTIAVYWGCITVDGEYHEFNYGGGWKGNGFVLASGTKRIYHNNNGSKSFSASGAVNIYASSGRQVEGSNSWSLNTIARKVNISSVTGSTTDEDFSPTVKWSNNGNRVDLKLELPDFGINPFKRWNDLQGSSSFRPTLTQAEKNQIMAKIPNGTTTKIRFTILTMIGGSEAFYDYIDKTFTIVNGEPSFSNFDYYDTNSATTAITGNNKILISGKSRLNVKISSANKAVARKSANMSSYSASLSGISSSANYASSDVNIAWGNNDFSSGSQTLTVRAHDSRGFSRAVSKNVTVIPYSNPDVAAKATRLNNFENQTTLHIEGKFSTVSVNNVVKNTIQSVQYRYKAQSTTSWGSWTNMAGLKVNGDRFTTNDVTLNLDNSKSYDFQVSVRDKLTTVTPSLTVSVGIPIFRIGTDGYVYNQEKRIVKDGDNISMLYNDRGYSDGYRLKGKDTRSSDYSPAYYMDKSLGIIHEFKNQSAVGCDGLLYGGYCQLITCIAWYDSSGGLPIQFAMNAERGDERSDVVAMRRAINDSTWGNWRSIPDSDTFKFLPMASKSIALGYGSSCTFYRTMNLVTVCSEIYFNGGNVGYSWSTLNEKMPYGFRPRGHTPVMRAHRVAGTGNVQWKVQSDGTMLIARQGDGNSGAWYQLAATWVTSDDMP